MSLRYPVTIRRRGAGAWVAGRWQEPAAGAAQTILASVQPAVLSDYDRMEPLPEGRRVEALVRVYTAEKLAVAGDGENVAGDLLEWPDGQGDQPYVFVARSPWQSRILPHFRYLAARVVSARTAP